ncbi:MAG: sulfatase-like hydrolase/transferase, partial [Phycisphaerales bacterium]
MKRRTFLRASAICTAAAACRSFASNPPRKERNRPNILLLFSDQHNAAVLGCAGHRLVNTPQLDRLASEGVLFSRAYCPDGICVPSRTSMF